MKSLKEKKIEALEKYLLAVFLTDTMAKYVYGKSVGVMAQEILALLDKTDIDDFFAQMEIEEEYKREGERQSGQSL